MATKRISGFSGNNN